VDSSFRIPGTSGPEIRVRRSVLGNVKVLADGVPIKRAGRRGLRYQIPLQDGTTTELQLTGQWTGMRAIVNGAQLPLERPLARWEVVLTFLPFLLAIVGGLLGAVFAIAGIAINGGLVRRAIRAPIKALVMVAITVLAVASYFVAVFAIAPLPTLTVGTCLNGIEEGRTVTSSGSRPIDCAVAHDNEIVGSVTHPGAASYPGQPALVQYGEAPCLTAFQQYVGVDFQSSGLDMLEVVPTDVTWLKGDRHISCIVLTRDGSRITGSVKGTAR
jgi:putative regulator of septum formation